MRALWRPEYHTYGELMNYDLSVTIRRPIPMFRLTIILVFGVMAAANFSISKVQSAAEALSVAPFAGGLNGTYLAVACTSCMLRRYLTRLRHVLVEDSLVITY